MGFTCCICQEELYGRVKKTGDDKPYERPIVVTKCGHLYHNDCLRKWFSSQGSEVWTSRNCPVCGMTLTVATDLIRIFTSSADEGGPSVDDLKLMIQKLEADKNELVKRLELSFLQSRDAQKIFDQFKRDNERMVEQLRKRQSENSKLKTENDELKNVVVQLSKSFANGTSSTQQQIQKPRAPTQGSNYIPSNLPPRFRPQANTNLNGKFVNRPPIPQQMDRQYQGMHSHISNASGFFEETKSRNQAIQNSGQYHEGISDHLQDMFLSIMSVKKGDDSSESENELCEKGESNDDKEVASAMGFSINNSSENHERTTEYFKSNQDDSNYFPRLPSESNSFYGSHSATNSVKPIGTEMNENNKIVHKAPSPTDEFLETLLNDTDEVEHVVEGLTEEIQVKNESKGSEIGPDAKITPYQGTKQCYGKYLCQKCNAKWGSSRSWANKPQMCLYCKTFVYPHAQAPLMSKEDLDKKIHY